MAGEEMALNGENRRKKWQSISGEMKAGVMAKSRNI